MFRFRILFVRIDWGPSIRVSIWVCNCSRLRFSKNLVSGEDNKYLAYAQVQKLLEGSDQSRNAWVSEWVMKDNDGFVFLFPFDTSCHQNLSLFFLNSHCHHRKLPDLLDLLKSQLKGSYCKVCGGRLFIWRMFGSISWIELLGHVWCASSRIIIFVTLLFPALFEVLWNL